MALAEDLMEKIAQEKEKKLANMCPEVDYIGKKNENTIEYPICNL